MPLHPLFLSQMESSRCIKRTATRKVWIPKRGKFQSLGEFYLYWSFLLSQPTKSRLRTIDWWGRGEEGADEASLPASPACAACLPRGDERAGACRQPSAVQCSAPPNENESSSAMPCFQLWDGDRRRLGMRTLGRRRKRLTDREGEKQRMQAFCKVLPALQSHAAPAAVK